MKIVVGYDGSEHANRALERAAMMAENGADILVVSAARLATLTHDSGIAPGGAGAGAIDPVEAEEARESLEKAKQFFADKGMNVRFIEGHGDPADTLVRIAKDEGADLIVVGTRGLNFAQRALLGSVSTKVVHHAECDVLVVR
jgi:nucleotide-binding universal stress UspA family protein